MINMNTLIQQMMQAQGGTQAASSPFAGVANGLIAQNPAAAGEEGQSFLNIIQAHLQKLRPASAPAFGGKGIGPIVPGTPINMEELKKALLLLTQNGVKVEKTADGGLKLTKDGKTITLGNEKTSPISLQELAVFLNQALNSGDATAAPSETQPTGPETDVTTPAIPAETPIADTPANEAADATTPAPVEIDPTAAEIPLITVENAGLIVQMLSEIQGQNGNTPISSEVLNALKEKIAALDLSNGKINREVLVKFKQEVIEELKAKGFDQPTINRYMVALAKFLRGQPQGPQATAPALPELAAELTKDIPATAGDISSEAELPVTDGATFLSPPPIQTVETNSEPVLSEPSTLAAAENKKPRPLPSVLLPKTAEAHLPSSTPAMSKAAARDLLSPVAVAGDGTEHDSALDQIVTLMGRTGAKPELPSHAAATLPEAAGGMQKPLQLPAQAQTLKTPAANVAASFFGTDFSSTGEHPRHGFEREHGFNLNNHDRTGGIPGSDTAAGAPELARPEHALRFTNFMNAAKAHQTPMNQIVNINLIRGLQGKMQSLIVQLEPHDLGRVEVKMKLDDSNTARVHMTVDKPETLAMLQRDTGVLERTLKSAGIDVDDKSLSFDLRQQGSDSERRAMFDDMLENKKSARDALGTEDAELQVMAASIAVQASHVITPSGVNIMV